MSYDDSHPQESVASPNSTYFVPAEAPPSQRRRFKRLWYYNEDLKRSRKQFNSQQLRERDKAQLFDSIASSLHLPHNISQDAKEILLSIDLTDAVDGQYTRIEVYCFALCVHSYNKEQEMFRDKYIPEKVADKNPQLFEEVRGDIDASKQDVRQAINELESLIDGNG